MGLFLPHAGRGGALGRPALRGVRMHVCFTCICGAHHVHTLRAVRAGLRNAEPGTGLPPPRHQSATTLPPRRWHHRSAEGGFAQRVEAPPREPGWDSLELLVECVLAGLCRLHVAMRGQGLPAGKALDRAAGCGLFGRVGGDRKSLEEAEMGRGRSRCAPLSRIPDPGSRLGPGGVTVRDGPGAAYALSLTSSVFPGPCFTSKRAVFRIRSDSLPLP